MENGIENVVQEKSEKKGKKGIIFLIILIALLIGAFTIFLFKNRDTIDKREENDNSEKKKFNISLNLFEEIKELPSYIKLYDNDYHDNYGYASYYISGNKLMYKEKVLGEVPSNGETKKFGNADDKYVLVANQNGENHIGVLLNDRYAYLETNSDMILYDINTGKEVVIPLSQYYVIGDYPRLDHSDELKSNSDKYIVINKDDKYGLIDFSNEKVIDLKYDDLYMINDDEMIAYKNGKYGVIDATETVKIAFEYDEIKDFDDYFVVQKDGKIGVIDSHGEEVIPFIKTIANTGKFSLRLCCGDENNFSISKDDDGIIISYYDDTEKKEKARYGYGLDYIVIDRDGDYHYKEDVLTKYYNYGDSYVSVKVEDEKVTFYDEKGKQTGTFKCDDGIASVNGYYDRENMTIYCSVEDEEEVNYYNPKQKRAVESDAVDDSIEENLDSYRNIWVYTYPDRQEVYTLTKKHLLTLDEKDVLYHVKDEYYKVVHGNDSVSYYYINY